MEICSHINAMPIINRWRNLWSYLKLQQFLTFKVDDSGGIWIGSVILVTFWILEDENQIEVVFDGISQSHATKNYWARFIFLDALGFPTDKYSIFQQYLVLKK